MKNRWYLGYTRGDGGRAIYLEDFSWDCGWYWGGGWITGRNFHTHFDGCFLDLIDPRGHSLGAFFTPWTTIPEYAKDHAKIVRNGAAVWEDLDFFLDNAQYTPEEWWRIKDLFKQFYALKAAAECFQYGGHCSGKGRNPQELNPWLAKAMNKQIETIIIPEIRKWMNHENRPAQKPENSPL